MAPYSLFQRWSKSVSYRPDKDFICYFYLHLNELFDVVLGSKLLSFLLHAALPLVIYCLLPASLPSAPKKVIKEEKKTDLFDRVLLFNCYDYFVVCCSFLTYLSELILFRFIITFFNDDEQVIWRKAMQTINIHQTVNDADGSNKLKKHQQSRDDAEKEEKSSHLKGQVKCYRQSWLSLQSKSATLVRCYFS